MRPPEKRPVALAGVDAATVESVNKEYLHQTVLASTCDQLAAYARIVWEPTDIVEIRILGNGPVAKRWHIATEIAKHADELVKLNQAQRGIYAGVCPRRAKGGSKNEDVELARVLVADFDDTTVEDALRCWNESGLPAPSMVIASGHGVHIFLRLASPIASDVFTALQADLAALVGSDAKIKDPARILRLPGFTNWKHPVATASLVSCDPALEYEVEELRRRIPVTERNGTPTETQSHDHHSQSDDADDALLERATEHLKAMPEAVSGKNGHDRTYAAAVALVHGFCLSKPTAMRLMLKHFNPRCRPPWTVAELQHKVDDAESKPHETARGWLRDAPALRDKKKVRPPPLPYRPFPLDLLPPVLGRFISETAMAMGCDPAFVALPALAATAASIGMSRSIELRSDWAEPAIIWALVLAPSGTLKSPAHDAAIKPLINAQIDMMREYDAAVAAYEKAKLTYDADLIAWKRKRQGDPPEAPTPPDAKRIVVNDVTIEALAPILLCNPRGLLLARDESSGWLRGFDQYKGGKGGDEARWLELHRGGLLIVDRKTGIPRTIFVPRAAVSVCGTIQPGIFNSVMSGAHTESGLAARLLIARPPVKPKRWTERGPPRAVVESYRELLKSLLFLAPLEGERGPEPLRMELDPEARAIWGDFYNRHARRTNAAGTDREAAALSKLEGYAARFALIFALAEDMWTTQVNGESMRRGVALAEWFAYEAERVYARIGESEADRELLRVADWIGSQGGSTTVRDLTRALRSYPTSESAEAVLNQLVAAGQGIWEESQPDGGGWPTRRLVLLDHADCRHSLEKPNENDQVSVSAAHVGVANEGESSESLGGPSDLEPPVDRPADLPYPSESHAHPRSADGVREGWTDKAWAVDLRRRADRCAHIRPDIAAEYRAEAERLDPRGAA